MAKKKRTAGPYLNEIYGKVAARADTEGLSISAADTNRVLACFFDVLKNYPAAEAFDLIAKGLKRASQRSVRGGVDRK